MKKILLVDDQPELCRLLELVLRDDGREIRCVGSGEEALDIAGEWRPDLILLDIMMPGGMDGIETIRTMKAEPETADIIIVIMTAKVQEKDRTEALEAGADGYLGKPFDLGQVKRQVEELLSLP